MTIRPRGRRPLRFGQFSPVDYPGLNGDKRLVATRMDIERSLLMVGYANAGSATATVGPWRAQLLSAMVQGYLNPDLSPSSYFLALEPSERVSMTFLLAQGFTHWAADAHMSVPILMHLKGTSPRWTLTSAPFVRKAGAGPVKPKGRPDFIGIASGAYHVFEAKGRSLQASSSSRSSTVAARCMSQALAQVSRIATVGGAQPKTRTAAVWVLRPGGLSGFVTDPPAAQLAYDLTFDLSAAILKYYRVVLDLAEEARSARGIRLVRLTLSETRRLVVEADLLETLRGLANGRTSATDVLRYLEKREATYRRGRRFASRRRGLAFGLDGIGLVGSDDRDPRPKPVEERPVEI